MRKEKKLIIITVNPLLDSRVYDVLFPDGSIEQYTANTISECIYSYIDYEGRRYSLLDQIADHRKNESTINIDQLNNKNRLTTKGWFLLVKWRDGSESWKPLADMKESYPVEVALYAELNNLIEQPAFKWWNPYTFKIRLHIISAVKALVKVKSHKYGVRVPNSVQEALELDKINGDDLWSKAIHKEMSNVSVAFDYVEEGKYVPAGYTFLPCKLILDVKINFTRKARYVAQGCFGDQNITGSNYAGVVSRESVRIALTYAALYDLDVYAADVQNAYLQAPSSEKRWTIAGPEFGSKKGSKMLIVRALYGQLSAGRDFRNHLR